jgi:hypothetical protein
MYLPTASAMFGARSFSDTGDGALRLGAGARMDAAELRADSPGKHVPTKGHVIDRIGFEINHLRDFCKTLAAAGVKFDQPYSKKRHKSFASAELIDPWGTSIELTEGLSKF